MKFWECEIFLNVELDLFQKETKRKELVFQKFGFISKKLTLEMLDIYTRTKEKRLIFNN